LLKKGLVRAERGGEKDGAKKKQKKKDRSSPTRTGMRKKKKDWRTGGSGPLKDVSPLEKRVNPVC